MTAPNINNTRQEVVRVDYDLSDNWRLTGRYTHDLSETPRAAGLVLRHRPAFPAPPPPTPTCPARSRRSRVKSILGSNRLNEAAVSVQQQQDRRRQRRTACATSARSSASSIPEVFPENINDLIPIIDVAGLGLLGANQLYSHPVSEPHLHRQLLVAARQSRVQVRRA